LVKFQIYKDNAGKFRFRLRADNGKIIAVGEAYEQYASCLNGIKSIQKNCSAPIEDKTKNEEISNPKYQLYKDNAGDFRFRLFARNGEMIADSSEGYESKDACLNGIKTVAQSCNAEIEDLTGTEPTMIENSPQTTDNSKKVINTEKEDQMLEELKKIREAVEKAPPPTPPKGFVNEFKDFISKYKILGLAVAFILGLYLGALVQALVKDFIIPLLGLLIPGMSDLATYAVSVVSQVFGIGDFLVALITFIAVALIVFIIVKVAKRLKID
jgi:large conductance mechanosensitive channel protein